MNTETVETAAAAPSLLDAETALLEIESVAKLLNAMECSSADIDSMAFYVPRKVLEDAIAVIAAAIDGELAHKRASKRESASPSN